MIFDALRIMGIGMATVFGLLLILFVFIQLLMKLHYGRLDK